MRFEEALKAMRKGKKVFRKYYEKHCSNTPVCWIDKNNLRYGCYVNDEWEEYDIPNSDIISEDWELK